MGQFMKQRSGKVNDRQNISTDRGTFCSPKQSLKDMLNCPLTNEVNKNNLGEESGVESHELQYTTP